jgi:hypothetical protein
LGSVWAREKREEREPVREGERLGPSVAHAGRGEERGPEGGEREGVWAAGCWALFFSSSFLFLSHTQLLKQIYLNSNKFKFKPYKLNTRKTMLQHECTNMLTL